MLKDTLSKKEFCKLFDKTYDYFKFNKFFNKSKHEYDTIKKWVENGIYFDLGIQNDIKNSTKYIKNMVDSNHKEFYTKIPFPIVVVRIGALNNGCNIHDETIPGEHIANSVILLIQNFIQEKYLVTSQNDLLKSSYIIIPFASFSSHPNYQVVFPTNITIAASNNFVDDFEFIDNGFVFNAKKVYEREDDPITEFVRLSGESLEKFRNMAVTQALDNVVYFLQLLNCKNVIIKDKPSINNKKGKSKHNYYNSSKDIWIKVPNKNFIYKDKIVNEIPFTELQKLEQGFQKRGHFKTFTEERPLFGKHTGTWWWSPTFATKNRNYKIIDTIK